MSSEVFKGSGVARPRTTMPRSLDLTVSVSHEIIKELMEELRRVVKETAREGLSAQLTIFTAENVNDGDVARPKATSRGIEQPPAEPIKAKDLRTALLLDKIPENALGIEQ